MLICCFYKTQFGNSKSYCKLFEKSCYTIVKHINNIFFKGELSEKTFGRNSDITNHNPKKLYNLDVIMLLVIGTNQKEEF